MDKTYVRVVESLIIFGLCFMVALTFASTVLRSLGYGGIYWAEELTRYTSIWVAFLGAGLGVRYGIHLRVDIMIDALPRRLKESLIVFSHLMVLLFALVLVIFGSKLSLSNYTQQSTSLRMPMTFAQAAIPVGAALMIYETLRKMIKQFKQWRANDTEKTSHQGRKAEEG